MSNEKALAEVIEAVKSVHPEAWVFWDDPETCCIMPTGLSGWFDNAEDAWRDAYSRLPSSTPPAQDEEFEKWARSVGITNFGRYATHSEYLSHRTELMARAWQAALASVLPAPPNAGSVRTEARTYEQGVEQGIRDAAKAACDLCRGNNPHQLADPIARRNPHHPTSGSWWHYDGTEYPWECAASRILALLPASEGSPK